MENRDTLARVVTCSFKYSVLTRSGRCLKNPHISQIIPFVTFRETIILDICPYVERFTTVFKKKNKVFVIIIKI